MKKPVFTGAATAVITPFLDGRLDLDALSRIIEMQYAGGVSALIVCGTTGENPTLTPAEHEALFRFCAHKCAGRMKLVAGIGSNSTEKALHMAQLAQDAGADALLMVAPYYNKTTQPGLIQHFTYVADRSELPLIVYNVPSRTGIGITPETYAILAQHPNIAGAKEASGDIGAFARTAALCGDDLVFWSGNDMDTVPMMALGAKGVISVASNVVPEAVTLLCRLCAMGNYPAAAALNSLYADLFHALFIEVNPIPVKAAMSMMGICSEELRLPLVPMSEKGRTELSAVLRKHRLI